MADKDCDDFRSAGMLGSTISAGVLWLEIPVVAVAATVVVVVVVVAAVDPGKYDDDDDDDDNVVNAVVVMSSCINLPQRTVTLSSGLTAAVDKHTEYYYFCNK